MKLKARGSGVATPCRVLFVACRNGKSAKLSVNVIQA